MKKFLKRLATLLGITLLLATTLVGIEYLGGQPMGLFAGTRPEGLGFHAGKFKPPSWKPNSVSSTVAIDDKHYIAPLAFSGDANAAWNKLKSFVAANKSAATIKESKTYLYAEYKSAGVGFVDDVEFALDATANAIHVRSASRLGVRDFDVNRKRVEAIRQQLAK